MDHLMKAWKMKGRCQINQKKKKKEIKGVKNNLEK